MPETRTNDKELSYREMQLAIKKIDRQILVLESFDVSAVQGLGDPRVRPLELSLKNMLLEIYGSKSTQYRNYLEITHIEPSLTGIYDNPSIQELRDRLHKGIMRSVNTLKSMKDDILEILNEYDEHSSTRSLKAYEALELHPEIARHVTSLYRDGHYSEAIERAFKALNHLIQLRSGEELDGVALMQKVFSEKNPILKFNNLSDPSDRNEQRGFMELFCGAVTGLRNPRAHKIIEDDPERTLEFIAFISLLAKLVEETT